MTTMMTSVALAAAAAMLAGCATVVPPPAAALPTPPAQWRHGDAAAASHEVTSDWWRSFGNAELAALVQRAQTQSLDVAAAMARVQQAEATARIAGSMLLPALDASVGASRDGRFGGHAGADGHVFGGGLSASYEIDVWGRHHAGRNSAVATWRASVYEHDTVQFTVAAATANAWLQAVALRQRIVIAEANLQSAERLLALVAARSRAGAATPLELAQQRVLVASQRRALAALRQQAEDARTALALLLGEAGELALESASLDPLEIRTPDAGLPADLLTRRPDIARAEAQLAAADADVTVARAAMWPRLTLAGSLTTSGDRLRRAFDNPVYSLAAALAAPIFDGGRLAAGRDLALARREELLANYRAAVVAAFSDVEVALNGIAGVQAQAVAHADELMQAQRALSLAESRYRAGAETLLSLLETQRTLYAAQDLAVQLKAQRLQATVALYKALGGGWSQPDAAMAATAANDPIRRPAP